MKYADSDLRLIIDGLAILGTWTDDIASKIVYSYDPNVYRDAKKFSFIHAKQVPLDDDKLEVFPLRQDVAETYCRRNQG